MRFIDADAHVEESDALFDYLEPEFRARRPIAVTLPRDLEYENWNGGWLIDGEFRHNAASPTSMDVALYEKGARVGSQELTDIGARLSDLDRMGVEKEVLYPSLFLNYSAKDVELEAALCRAYNSFMADVSQQSSGRLTFAAIVPWRRPEEAAAELRRVADRGAVAVMVHGIEWDIPIHDPSLDPIYAVAQEQGLAVSLHTGWGSPQLREMFWGRRSVWSKSTGYGGAMGMTQVHYGMSCLLGGKVLQRFPQLHLTTLELGAHWFVPIYDRANDGIKAMLDEAFASRRFFMSCEPNEDLRYLFERLGDDWLVVASDFPHLDGSRHDDPAQEFRDAGVPDASLAKLMAANAEQLYPRLSRVAAAV